MRQVLPKILWSLLAMVSLVSCGAPGVPLPPSLELPVPVSDLRAVRKGDKVYLAWTVPSKTTDQLTVRHLGPTKICRSLTTVMKECGSPVGEVPALPTSSGKLRSAKTAPAPPKVQNNYVDTVSPGLLTNPTGFVHYAVVVTNDDGKGAGLSNQVQVSAAPTLPAPADFGAQVTVDGIVLNWTGVNAGPATPELRYVYRVFRRPDGGKNGAAIGDIPLDSASQTEFVDHTFEWTKTYFYRGAVVTLKSTSGAGTGDAGIQIEGDDTPEVKVVADDIFPPAVPTGVQAVFSGAGQQSFVDLIWAPDTEGDLVGYNIYRHEAGAQPVKLNSEPVTEPAFRDSNVMSGRKYFYSVSAVDSRGNESARSEETSEEVP